MGKAANDKPKPGLSGSGHTITRSDLCGAVQAALSSLSRVETRRIVDDVIVEMSEELLKGQQVRLRGFGSFRIRERQARRGRNPRTGDLEIMSTRRLIKFWPSPILRSKINGQLADNGEG